MAIMAIIISIILLFYTLSTGALISLAPSITRLPSKSLLQYGPTWTSAITASGIGQPSSCKAQSSITAIMAMTDSSDQTEMRSSNGISFRELFTPPFIDSFTVGWTLAGQGVLLNIALITDLIGGSFISKQLHFGFSNDDILLALEVSVPMVFLGVILDNIPIKIFQEIALDTRIFVLTLFGRSSSTLNTAAAAFIVSLGAGISEELFFRGIIFNFLSNFFGDTPASLISSGIFGLAHFPVFGANAFIEAFLGGIFAFSYQYSDYNLVVPIIAHSVYDFMTIMITWWVASSDLKRRIEIQTDRAFELITNDSAYFQALSRAVFDSLDMNKDGVLDERELNLGLRLYGMGPSFLKERLQSLINKNKGTFVDYETFVKILEDGIKVKFLPMNKSLKR